MGRSKWAMVYSGGRVGLALFQPVSRPLILRIFVIVGLDMAGERRLLDHRISFEISSLQVPATFLRCHGSVLRVLRGSNSGLAFLSHRHPRFFHILQNRPILL